MRTRKPIFKEAQCDVVLLKMHNIRNCWTSQSTPCVCAAHLQMDSYGHHAKQVKLFFILSYHVCKDEHTENTETLCLHTDNTHDDSRIKINHLTHNTYIQDTRSKTLFKKDRRLYMCVWIYVQMWTRTWMYACVTQQSPSPVDLDSQAKRNERDAHTHMESHAPMMLAERSRWSHLPASQQALVCYLSLLFPGRCSPALPPLLLLVLYCIHIHFPPILLQLGGRVSHDR